MTLLCCLASLGTLVGCPFLPTQDGAVNPFRDLPVVPLDGEPRTLRHTVAPLGHLTAGDVIRIRVTGDAVAAVLILIEDEYFDEAGALAGGGQANALFQYRVRLTGRYFVFVLFDPTTPESDRRATLTVEPGDPAELAAALGLLLEDGDLRRELGRRARRRFEVEFTLPVMGRRVLALYDRLLSGAPAAPPRSA